MPQKLTQQVYAEPGITKDGTRFDSSTYILGDWVRFYKKRPQKIGGYLMLTPGTPQIPRSLFLAENLVTTTTLQTDVDIYVGYQGSSPSGNAQAAVLVYALSTQKNATNAPIDRSPSGSGGAPTYRADPANVWSFETIYGSDGSGRDALSDKAFILAHVAPTAVSLNSPDSGGENTSEGQIYYGLAQGYSPDYVPLVPMMQNGKPFNTTTNLTNFQTADNGICVIGGYIFALNNQGVVSWNTAFPATGVIGDINNKVAPFPTQYCVNYWNPNSFFVIGSDDFIYGAPVRVGNDIGGLLWTGSSLVRAVKTPVDQSLVPQPSPVYLLKTQVLPSTGITITIPTPALTIPQQIAIDIEFNGVLSGSGFFTITVNGVAPDGITALNDQLTYLVPGTQTTTALYGTVNTLVITAFGGVTSPTITSILSSYVKNTQDPGLYTWLASYVSTVATCLSAKSIVSYEPFFFWVGVDTFYQYNGAVSEVKNETNKKWFFDNLNREAAAQVTSFVNIQFQEWWILFPKGNATECNWALVYNIEYDCWFDTPTINRSCALRSTSLYSYPVMGSSILDSHASPNYPIFAHEYGYDATYGEGIDNSFAILSGFSTLLSLESNPPNTKNAVIVNQITLDLDQEGNMNVAVSPLAYPRSLPSLSNTKVFTFSPIDTFLTTSVNGTLLLLTFVSDVVGGYYLMGKTLVEYIVTDSEREEPK